MKKSTIRNISVLGVILLILGGIAYKNNLFTKNSENQVDNQKGVSKENESKPKPTTIKITVAQKEILEEKIQTRGSLLPNEAIMIVSEQAGVVKKIHFNEGTFVKKGELLVSLDDDEWIAQLKRAESELNYLIKKEQLDKKLLEKDGVSQLEYEQDVRDLNIKKADIELLQARIAKTKILAPFSGRVGLRQISEGGYVSPATIITQLVDNSVMKLDFTVPEKYMSLIKTGTEIQFKIEGISKTMNGKIYAIDPQIDVNTRTIRLRAISNQISSDILAGAFANIEIILNKITDAVAVPTESIIPEMNGKKVFLVKNGKAKSSSIETGLRTATKVQVLKGITLGDTVITSGIMNIRDGAEVFISNLSE
jgi:membrane fusion protein (multidrug efflux system)